MCYVLDVIEMSSIEQPQFITCIYLKTQMLGAHTRALS